MDKRIGAQLYTVRNTCQELEDFDLTLKKISEIGYQTVQVSGVGNFTGEEIKKILDKYGLEAVCTHRPWKEYEENLDGLIQYHKALGCKIAGLGSVPNMVGNFEQAKLFAEQVNPIAAKLKENGLTFAYHNHHHEFEKRDGESIFDILIQNTNPENCKLIVDAYWVAYAGFNPAQFIRKYKERIVCVHLKDMGVIGREINMFEVGYGNIDWEDVLTACEECGVSYVQVEQDTCRRDPFESLKMSYEYLKTKGYC